MEYTSIFKQFYTKIEFLDRKIVNNEDGIDVIIPIINTNELFKKNLYSIYREVPINTLIIGNGGCTDISLEILKDFPRVKIIDQIKNRTLGYCIAELITQVRTEWFAYFHADVYLPPNWYDKMIKYQHQYDWYECGSYITTLVQYKAKKDMSPRAYSGSQIGRKKAFQNILPKIDDDFLYRNEDIILHELIQTEGYKYGRVLDTFHYHEVMNKRGEMEPNYQHVIIKKAPNREWEINTNKMQIKGIIKYLKPKPYLIRAVNIPLKILKEYNAINEAEFYKWVKKNNPIWLKYINIKDSFIKKIIIRFQELLNKFLNKLIEMKI